VNPLLNVAKEIPIESLSDADESGLDQYIEAFKKIYRSDNRARAGIGELVHLAAGSRGNIAY
jgi:hypothetical protein